MFAHIFWSVLHFAPDPFETYKINNYKSRKYADFVLKSAEKQAQKPDYSVRIPHTMRKPRFASFKTAIILIFEKPMKKAEMSTFPHEK